ncbi:uncharacterized protein A1O5_08092 [Cladophialophora psammophila CBS 110553]|uniref:Serine hydrolase domain-containing protein n=1 Tax=Cladophialophora psammophila CBS 110553 TaxID=1182543 RepID=W9WLT9_9EURO|nr:uncharacterized protein A1O5_08092 [Cladophialophora psammophila CBS 110553]EXJ69157.1 hypothetical protein A1O5_08092 [Cladophialophora psammophila CBS 110553]
MTVKKTPKKALLCFHGTGSRRSIFNVQMARICYQLRDVFEFIFLDGPLECGPGPGVLPMFSGQEPYRGWFHGHEVSIDESIREINGAVQTGLDDWRSSNADADVENIVGAVGFSEGGLALTLMLWLQQEQRQQQEQQQEQEQQVLLSALPTLQFAAISCCFFPREASLWMNARAQARGKKTALIDVPTLHIHGNRDFYLGRARQLVRNHYQPQCATIVQVDTSHHLPTQKDDGAEVFKHIRRLAGVKAE